jgi:hypothetical protein
MLATMKSDDDFEPLIVVYLDAREAGDVIGFKRLCHEKFGQRFQHDENFRHQAVDVLLAGVETIGK